MNLDDLQPPTWVTVLTGPIALAVSADYVKDVRGMRVALRPADAQAVADHFAAMLPTPKMVRLFESRAVRLAFHGLSDERLSGEELSSPRLVALSNHLCDEAIKRAGPQDAGALYAGHKKDIVVCKTLIKHPTKVAIYGAMDAEGKRVQPLFPEEGEPAHVGHSREYFDYSHGTRLVKLTCVLGGAPAPVVELLDDRVMSAVLSGEGRVPAAALRY